MTKFIAKSLKVRIGGKLVPFSALRQKVGVPTPLAQWDFSAEPFKTTTGDLPLEQAGSTRAVVTGSPFGTAAGIALDGSAFLRLDKSAVGRLNIGARGKAVTVAAWLKHSDTNAGFVGGCWQEDAIDPRRSYGLFYDLNTYGGDERSNFHVSKTGRPTPGYPFSRDYSASGQTFKRGVWQLHVGTYDGTDAVSYLDGSAVSYPSYTDPLNQTYAKNPYRFLDGLNGTPCDFTVGAVELTNGPGNFVIGSIARLRVWDTALTPQQVQALYKKERPS
ncbi:LamG-like jellyroll fold domain-containing protein [Rathayibacter sp. AY1B5]|uniref:LamG-like jellyroll fold domain-containing protein n=1 Tax=Rathayibacter sp. AY1B5 TaxID=2080530 RepID=UPI0015E30A80|nr:LamG-like jellyroll fold domain-containing protein [Rathayibacter sp. AY1B5]